MNNQENMTWKDFREALQAHPNLNLQFQYHETHRVDAAYHLTEIKQAPITSVDCGGVMNQWTEVIIQLWEPANQQQQKPMKVKKALAIIDLVERSMSLYPQAIVKIEFGNAGFDTRQMHPHTLLARGDDLVVDLRPAQTQCKAMDRGGSCGIPAPSQSATIQNVASSACIPGSGCC